MKLLHLADLHLDRPFVGLAAQDARARRRELREALDRCLALAVAHRVDAVTVGGDLWEDEHVTPDTCRWVADRLGSVGVPVVLVAGNHDPLRPGGPHRRVRWPANVHLLPADPSPTPGLQRWDLGERTARHGALDEGLGGDRGARHGAPLHSEPGGGLTVWGASWGAAPLTARVLEGFTTPADGRTHVLLLHGTAGAAAGFGAHPSAHCPFTARAVRDAGFALCLAGHLHAGGVRDGVVVYPGSPEPLAWDETGRHAVALVELPAGAPPRVELLDVNRRRCVERVVDCTGAGSSAEVERALREAIAEAVADGGPEGLCLRAVLRGRVDPECRVDVGELAAATRGALALLDLREETQPAFDLDALAALPTALGAFVRDLRGRLEHCDADEPQQRRLALALDLGLRAMHGEGLAHAA